MIGLTTGRQTNQRLNSFLNELAYSIPNSKVIRRGKSNLEGLEARFRSEDITCLLMLRRWHGGPGRIDFYEVMPSGLTLRSPSILLKNVKLRREQGNHGRVIAREISCDEGSSDTIKQFVHCLSGILQLPGAHSTRFSRSPKILVAETIESLRLSIIDSQGIEVGPSLVISRLIWDLDGRRI